MQLVPPKGGEVLKGLWHVLLYFRTKHVSGSGLIFFFIRSSFLQSIVNAIQKLSTVLLSVQRFFCRRYKFLESELISSRKAMPRNPHHTRRFLDTKVYTKPRKLCTADDADFRCEHSLGHGEPINTYTVIQRICVISRDIG